MSKQILLLVIAVLVISSCDEENGDRLKENLSLTFVNETEESFEEVKLYAGQHPSSSEDFNKSDSLVFDIQSKDAVSTAWNPKVNRGEGGLLLSLTDQRQRAFGYYTRSTMFGYDNFKIVIKADTILITQSE